MYSKKWNVVSPNNANVEGYGITTGTCAAAAACASAIALSGQTMPDNVLITTPDGVRVQVTTNASVPDVDGLEASYNWAQVIKDAGDDPDVTDGVAIYALVRPLDEKPPFEDMPCMELELDGPLQGSVVCAGVGVGKVTLEGLKNDVESPAINPGPRLMIENALKTTSLTESVRVTISIPEGLELANRTFNPRLGIVDGISVLGTTGFVRPMSDHALVDSIMAEVDVRLAHSDSILLTFGATGERAACKSYEISENHSVQMSNFVGAIFDGAVERGAKNILVAGHPGKLIKVSAGIMDTHSSSADARAEILTAHAALAGANLETIRDIWKAISTQKAIEIIDDNELNEVWDRIAERCVHVLQSRALRKSGEQVKVACSIISRGNRILAEAGAIDKIVSLLAN